MTTPGSRILIINTIALAVACGNEVDTHLTHAHLARDHTSDRIGSTAGKFRVSESGAATYSVPIAAAAGTAGVAPRLSLNYSSQDGNGLLGRGWSVSGVSRIRRCRQTVGIDGVAKAITWSEDDRFCLNGQRMVVVESTAGYGAVGAIYRTETEQFVTITSVGGEPGHPAYFTIDHKDGSRTTYGESPNARQMAGNYVLTWAQDTFADSVGNAIRYDYRSDGGFRLHEASYAYGADTTPQAKILLDYEDARPDPVVQSVAGHTFVAVRRLKSVSVLNGEVALRTYTLTYADTTETDRISRVRSLQECRDDVCLAATTFSWSESDLALDPNPFASVTLESQDDQHAISPRHADINNDGRQDLIWLVADWDKDGKIHDQYWQYVLATDTGFSKVRTAYHDSGNVYNPYKWDMTDFNADGRIDLMVRLGNQRWYAVLSTPQSDGNWLLSSAARVETPVTDEKLRFVDINGDGLTDVVTDDGYHVREVDSSQEVTSNHYYNFGPKQAFEWVGMEGVERSEPDWVDCTIWDDGVALPSGTRGVLSDAFGDFDGDGQVEVIGFEVRCTYPEDVIFPPLFLQRKAYVLKIQDGQLVNVGAVPGLEQSVMLGMFAVNASSIRSMFPIQAGDLNADGLPDVVYREAIHVDDNGDTGAGTLHFHYALNSGNGFSVPVMVPFPAPTKNAADLAKIRLSDFNGDGSFDIVYHDHAESTLYAMLWNGDGFDDPTEVFFTGSDSRDTYHGLQDVNGDGRHDYVFMDKHTVSVHLCTGSDLPTRMITDIDNGLGAQTTIRYDSLSRTQHYTQTGAGPAAEADVHEFYDTLNGPWDGMHALEKTGPVLPLKAPVYVVTEVDSTAPAASDAPGQIDVDARSRVSYHYSDAKVQAAGRGLLGFKTLKTVDEQTKVATVTTYRQDFPFIGYPAKTEVFSGAGHRLSTSSNTWKLENWDSGNPIAPYRPYIADTTEQTYDLVDDGMTQGALLRTTVTTNVYDDYDGDGVSDVGQYYGNLTWSAVVTIAHGSPNAQSSGETTVNTYGETPFERRTGRVSRTVVTSQRPGWPDMTRTTAFTYYTSEHGNLRGLLRTRVIEPDDPEYEFTTTIGYDAFGNKTTVARTGLDREGQPVTRQRRVIYEPTGRYADKHFNHRGHLTKEVVERNDFGSPTVVRGLNGFGTVSLYGVLGRKYWDADNTGSSNLTVFRLCDTVCPASAIYIAEAIVSGGGKSREYMDARGRPVREAVLSFDGRWSYTDTEYDKLGRVRRKSNPYFPGEPIHWVELSYDILGRVVSTTVPGITNPTRIDYPGFDTVTTNPLGQTQAETRNVHGELVQVVDSEQGKVTYDYDSLGRLRRVNRLGSPTDPHNVTTVLDYDVLGRKTYLNDPDKGEWHYKHNGFGDLVEQRDAKGQVTTMKHDELGRMTRRQDLDATGTVQGDTEWIYDLAANGLGELAGVRDHISGYKKTHTFDGFGRPKVTTTCVGLQQCYSQEVTYDEHNRRLRNLDAAGDGSGVEHRYVNGYLSEIVDIREGASTPYYKVNAMDARGRVSEFVHGNGIVTRRTYDPATGRLQSLKSGALTAGILNANVQDLHYAWDDLDNLTQRRDDRRSLTEDFLSYDGLNRLVSSQVVGQAVQTVGYDSLGNIRNKSGLGDYIYSGVDAGPHAVTSTGDGVTYEYDRNGNMTGDSSGRTVEYTTFDKPRKITRDNHVTLFAYGPDRSRYMRVDNNAVKVYIGNVEIITFPDGTRELRRHLNGTAMVTTRYSAVGAKISESTRYLHHDHLGSLDVLTDEAGTIVEEMSFDAWGRRRNPATWASYDVRTATNITDRGYTGHEQLDDVGLIHMNGRVYDPHLGRFLQADPFVQDASDTQLYNRYSYLRNNALNATDPSGYFIQALVIGAFIGYGASVAAANFDAPWLTAVAGFLGCISLNPVACGAGFGFGSTLGAGGSFLDALKSGLIAGASAYAFGQIDAKFAATSEVNKAAGVGIKFGDTQLTLAQHAQQVTAHAVVGGVASELEGGKFGHGFARAGLTSVGITVAKGAYHVAKRAVIGKIEDRLETLACELACEVFPDADDVEAAVHIEDIDLGFPETSVVARAGVRIDLPGHDVVAVLGEGSGKVNVVSGKVSADATLAVGGRKHFNTKFLGLNKGIVELGVLLGVNSRESLSVSHFTGARMVEGDFDFKVLGFNSNWIPLAP